MSNKNIATLKCCDNPTLVIDSDSAQLVCQNCGILLRKDGLVFAAESKFVSTEEKGTAVDRTGKAFSGSKILRASSSLKSSV